MYGQRVDLLPFSALFYFQASQMNSKKISSPFRASSSFIFRLEKNISSVSVFLLPPCLPEWNLSRRDALEIWLRWKGQNRNWNKRGKVNNRLLTTKGLFICFFFMLPVLAQYFPRLLPLDRFDSPALRKKFHSWAARWLPATRSSMTTLAWWSPASAIACSNQCGACFGSLSLLRASGNRLIVIQRLQV